MMKKLINQHPLCFHEKRRQVIIEASLRREVNQKELDKIKKDFSHLNKKKESLPDWFSDGEGEEELDFNFGQTIEKTQNFQKDIQEELVEVFEKQKQKQDKYQRQLRERMERNAKIREQGKQQRSKNDPSKQEQFEGGNPLENDQTYQVLDPGGNLDDFQDL